MNLFGDNGEDAKKAYDLIVNAGVKDINIKLFEGDRH